MPRRSRGTTTVAGPRGIALAWAAALVVASMAPAPPDGGPVEDARSVRERALKSTLRGLVAEGRLKAFRALVARLDEAAERLKERATIKVGAAEPVWAAIESALSDSPDEGRPKLADRRVKAVADLDAALGRSSRKAEAAWMAAASALGWPDRSARIGPATGDPEPVPEWSGWAVGHEPPIAAAVVALGWLLFAVDQRRAIRRMIGNRGRGVAALVLIGLAPALVGGCAPDPLDGLVDRKPVDDPGPAAAPAAAPAVDAAERLVRLKDWAKRAEDRARSAEKKAKEAQDEAARKAREVAALRLRASLPVADAPLGFDPEGKPSDRTGAEFLDRLLAAEAEVQAPMIEAIGAAGAEAELVADFEKAVKDLKDHPEVAAARAEAHQGGRAEHGGRLALAAGALALAWAPLVLGRRGRGRMLRELSWTCPRCNARASLSEVDRGMPHKQMYCSNCQYEFEKSYLGHERFSMPTIGIPSSGKTMWMMMLFDLVNSVQVPNGVSLRILPSSLNSMLIALIQALKVQRVLPPANQNILTDPLIFYQKDRPGLLGRGETLVNLFDFSGEIMFQPAYQSALKQRAMACEGVVVFLDPTNPNYAEQIDTLKAFLDDLRLYRTHAVRSSHRPRAGVQRVDLDRKIDLPVAVCVTKIDLLTTLSPMGESARAWLAQLRKTADKPLGLRTIRWRSAHVARVVNQLFPGAGLIGTLQRELGGRVMFFPMSTISIEDAELGVEDLHQRSFYSFGVLEPFFWLLHMNGSNVLR